MLLVNVLEAVEVLKVLEVLEVLEVLVLVKGKLVSVLEIDALVVLK